MANEAKKFEALSSDEKAAFKDGLNTYLGYLEEMGETKEAIKNQIQITTKKIPTLDKKEVKKLFNYFKKHTTPAQLREDAQILEEVNAFLK